VKIRLGREVEGERDIDQGALTFNQQGFGSFQTPLADISMGGLSRGAFEGSGKMKFAQARDFSHLLETEIALKIRLDEIENTTQSPFVQRACWLFTKWRSRAGMPLHQPLREGSSQCRY
jgi:hypothetical protein